MQAHSQTMQGTAPKPLLRSPRCSHCKCQHSLLCLSRLVLWYSQRPYTRPCCSQCTLCGLVTVKCLATPHSTECMRHMHSPHAPDAKTPPATPSDDHSDTLWGLKCLPSPYVNAWAPNAAMPMHSVTMSALPDVCQQSWPPKLPDSAMPCTLHSCGHAIYDGSMRPANLEQHRHHADGPPAAGCMASTRHCHHCSTLLRVPPAAAGRGWWWLPGALATWTRVCCCRVLLPPTPQTPAS
mmetsp:Transcript_35492/g.89804  ORF Transcript_35492/g.89804 Transcript_35492/m.89804 type:complete len:238 (+) Transcript_35492:1341-2054(+)